MTRRVLVLGASGFVGRHVRPALEEAGWVTRLGTRDPDRAREKWGPGDWVQCDVEEPNAEAFDDVHGILYLVHQMRDESADLLKRETESAARVARLAEAAGVRRIVYLGGPQSEGGSHHLAARRATGEALRGGAVTTIELQAAMIIGAGSESWWICRDLAFRLPVMTLPPWSRSRSQPIAIRDVVAALVRSLDLETDTSLALPLPGPETLSAEEILRRVARHGNMRPLMIHLPFLTPRVSSHWLRFVTRADFRIAQQLVEGLETDLISPDAGFWLRAPDIPRTGFDDAVQIALAAEPSVPGATAALWERIARRFSLSPT